jgi:hypothetical protein
MSKSPEQFARRVALLANHIKSEVDVDRHAYQARAAFMAYYGDTHHFTVEVVRHVRTLTTFDRGPGWKDRYEDAVCQLWSLLEATAEDVSDGWDYDPVAAGRVQAEEGLLDVAQGLLLSSPLAAAMVAGAVLENHLRSLCTTRGLIPKDRGISSANDKLKGPVYEKVQWREIQVWGDLRNAADHHDLTQFDEAKVPGMIAGIRLLIETHPA